MIHKRNSLLSASLMCMDLLNVQSQISVLNRYMDALHVDIMDGHFCDSIHLSPSFIGAIRQITQLPIETHLMVDAPEKFINSIIDNGGNCIICHAETVSKNAFRLIDAIHSKGKKGGIALCPLTPIDAITPLLGEIDILSILMIDVGYIGQPMIGSLLGKIKLAKDLKEQQGYDYIIQVDGGVRADTYQVMKAAGAESFVLGKAALFGKHVDINDACEIMSDEFGMTEEVV